MEMVSVPALVPGMSIAPEQRGGKPREIRKVVRKADGGVPSKDGLYYVNDDMVMHASHALLIV